MKRRRGEAVDEETRLVNEIGWTREKFKGSVAARNNSFPAVFRDILLVRKNSYSTENKCTGFFSFFLLFFPTYFLVLYFYYIPWF